VENLWTIRANPVDILMTQIFLQRDREWNPRRRHVDAAFAIRFA
jgi:hypothetical protein